MFGGIKQLCGNVVAQCLSVKAGKIGDNNTD